MALLNVIECFNEWLPVGPLPTPTPTNSADNSREIADDTIILDQGKAATKRSHEEIVESSSVGEQTNGILTNIFKLHFSRPTIL